MRLFITGATGLIGRRLVLDRLERGDQVVLLSRDGARASRLFAAEANRNVTVISGDPKTPGPWQQAVDGCDAIVHLAGASIGDRRWTAAYKREIVSSRVEGTHHIVLAIKQAERPPRVLISGSAIGYYGDTADRQTDEQSPPGEDFLAALAVTWESRALAAESLGVRVVLLRTGLVLDSRGGALTRMARPVRWFAGGPIGSGRQFMSWIHWRDLIGLIDLALERPSLRGSLNAVSPHPVRNREFVRTLASELGRPAFMPAPRLLLRAVLGEVANYIVMSARILPSKAIEHGYRFLHPELEGALSSLLTPREAEESAEPAAPLSAARSGSASAAMQEVMPEAPIRLLAIDVDGTLLRSDGSLPQGVIQACRSAERAGCVVVLASARPPRALKQIAQAMDLTAPTINHNGAVIWNPQENQALFHEPLDAQTARELIALVRATLPDLLIGIESVDRWYTDRIDPRLTEQFGRLVQPDAIGPLEGFLTEPVTKLNLIAPREQLQAVKDAVRERFWKPRLVSVYQSDPFLIQILHPLVDKAIALQRIARRQNVTREQIMAIGDGTNALGMIEWAGFGVAVENACEQAKAIARAIVPSNDDLGVARAIQRYVLARR